MGVEKNQIPLVEGLFTWPSDEPKLIVGRCKACKSVFFPKDYKVHSPDCKGADLEEVLLSSQGTLTSFTNQLFKPPLPYKGPDPFVPYCIGMVEFPEDIQIYGMMTGCKLEDLKIGMKVETVFEKQCEDEQGNEMLTWKFKPVQ